MNSIVAPDGPEKESILDVIFSPELMNALLGTIYGPEAQLSPEVIEEINHRRKERKKTPCNGFLPCYPPPDPDSVMHLNANAAGQPPVLKGRVIKTVWGGDILGTIGSILLNVAQFAAPIALEIIKAKNQPSVQVNAGAVAPLPYIPPERLESPGWTMPTHTVPTQMQRPVPVFGALRNNTPVPQPVAYDPNR